MSLDWYKHLYGFSNGIYFTVVAMLFLFGFSYRRTFSWKTTAAFSLIAVSYICFGLYSIFFQQLFTNITAPLYSTAFLKLCAMLTPVSLLILTYIYTKSFTMRSIKADALVKKEWWIIAVIYVTAIVNIIAIYFIDDVKTIAWMLLMGFALPCLGACRLALVADKTSTVNMAYAKLFGILFVLIFTSGQYSISHAESMSPLLVMFMMMFFSVIVILAGFFTIRYGHEEMRSFFRIRSLDKKNIMADITTGINKNQFLMHYQPQLDLQTGKVTAAEALIRWDHPEKGMIAPDDYIPLAEESGLISHISMWVISRAIREAAQLRERGFELKISINFSPKDITAHVISHLEHTLEKHNYPSELVVIEITEGQMINSEDTSFAEYMQRLHELGVSISIDDYGTGFSSLSHMQRLQIHELKVDKTFIKNLQYGSNNYAIVYSTLQMARNLNLVSVAEGVEDFETLQILQELQCNLAQGYGIAKPMPFDELVVWLDERTENNTITNFKAVMVE